MSKSIRVELDPPLCIPPLGRATFEIAHDLRIVSVRVWDRDDKCVAFGQYVRVDPSKNRFTLHAGNAYQPQERT
jgi:hypothetical protein